MLNTLCRDLTSTKQSAICQLRSYHKKDQGLLLRGGLLGFLGFIFFLMCCRLFFILFSCASEMIETPIYLGGRSICRDSEVLQPATGIDLNKSYLCKRHIHVV